MNELRSSVIHHIEQAAKKAGVNFDRDCRAELEADFDAAERRIAAIETRLRGHEGTLLMLVSFLPRASRQIYDRVLKKQLDVPK